MNSRAVEAIYGLSPQQQGMLFETLLAPQSGIFVEQEVFAWSGALERDAFRRAWQQILDRHSILRTAFVWRDQDEPLQVVLKQVEVPLHYEDWRELAPSEQQRRLEQYLAEIQGQGFELTKAPLLRLALFQTGDTVYQFVSSQHHILMDGWCRPLILKEFGTLYRAFCQGYEPQLEPSRPYRDYIVWLGKQDLSKAESFWRQALHGFEGPTRLGRDEMPRPAPEPVERYGTVESCLSPDTTTALQALVRQHHLTFNTLVQGLWSLLLSRYSGERTVVFGTTVSGRPADLADAESMIGLFINTLPFRVAVQPQARLWSWLGEIQFQHLQLREYEYCSNGQIHEWSSVPGSLPLYESLLVFENYPAEAVASAAEGAQSGLPLARGSSAYTNHALTILATVGRELLLHLVHDWRRLNGTEVARIGKHFIDLCESIVANPDQELDSLLAQIPEPEIPTFLPLHRFRHTEGRQLVAPRSPTEELLVDIWQRVLQLERVGVCDNFFEIGGHSLLAMQLASRIRDTFDIDFPLRLLFETPTIEGLALVIEDMIIAELESLSEEEALALVQQEL